MFRTISHLSIILFICMFFLSCAQATVNVDDSITNHKENEITKSILVTSSADISIKSDKYISFIKSQLKLDDDNIFLFTDEIDLDKDGNVEVLCRVKNHDIYTLRNKNGVLSFVGEKVNIAAYSKSRAKIVNMRDSKDLYIYITVTNDINMDGFSLLKLEDNQLKIVKSSWAESGAGDDYLTSSKEDGIYDGFMQERYGMETMHIPTFNKFIWNSETKEFKFSETITDVGEYPSDISEFIDHYISLRCMDNGVSSEITKRLKEMNPSGVDCLSEELISTIKNDFLYTGENIITYDIDHTRQIAWANILYKMDNIFFNLEKKDGKWIITSSRLNPGDSMGAANDEPIIIDYADKDDILPDDNLIVENENGEFFFVGFVQDVSNISIIRIEDDKTGFPLEKEKLKEIEKIKAFDSFYLKTNLSNAFPKVKISFDDDSNNHYEYLLSYDEENKNIKLTLFDFYLLTLENKPLTLDEAKEKLKVLMDKGWEVLYYYSNEGLPVDYDAEAKIVDDEKYYPVKSTEFKSIKDIKTATEQVFTHEFARKTFYQYAFDDDSEHPPLYKEIDGMLYESTPGGRGYALELLLDTMVIKRQTVGSLFLQMDTKVFDEPYGKIVIILKNINDNWLLDSEFY